MVFLLGHFRIGRRAYSASVLLTHGFLIAYATRPVRRPAASRRNRGKGYRRSSEWNRHKYANWNLHLRVGAYGLKVCALEELEAALKVPTGVAPTRCVWIHESLEGAPRRLWEAVR